MDRRMEQAVANGDADTLYRLIGEDAEIWKHFEESEIITTPLHKAAECGNIEFALELIQLKPSLAKKLNPNGLSPIHIALQNGHIDFVRSLLQIDGELARVKGKGGLTPLLQLVKSGEHSFLLEELLLASPDAITDLTVKKETILHVALKNDKLMAFNFLVTWLAKVAHENAKMHQKTILNGKDIEGDTVLHIAVSKDQTQAVRHLLAWGYKFVDANLKNLQGDTAWDVLQKRRAHIHNEEIEKMLRGVNAKPSSALSSFNTFEKYQKLPASICFQFLMTDIKREMRTIPLERLNNLLVVAILLLTLSFQAIITPPGGLWQDNGLCNTTEVGYRPDGNLSNLSNTTLPKTDTGFIMPDTDNKVKCEHKAGTAIPFKDGLFQVFLAFNTILFLISNSTVIILSPNWYIKVLSFVPNVGFCFTYSYVLLTITGNPHEAYMVGILTVISSLLIFVAQLYSWK